MPPSFLFFFQKDSTSTKGEGTRRVSISSSAHRRTVSSGEKYSDVVTGLIKLEIEDKQYANETHWYVTGTFRCLEPAWTPSRWSLKSVLWCRWKKKKSLAQCSAKKEKKKCRQKLACMVSIHLSNREGASHNVAVELGPTTRISQKRVSKPAWVGSVWAFVWSVCLWGNTYFQPPKYDPHRLWFSGVRSVM